MEILFKELPVGVQLACKILSSGYRAGVEYPVVIAPGLGKLRGLGEQSSRCQQ